MVASAQVENRQSYSANRKKQAKACCNYVQWKLAANRAMAWGREAGENDFSRQNKADIAENDIGRLRIQCARDNVKEKTLF